MQMWSFGFLSDTKNRCHKVPLRETAWVKNKNILSRLLTYSFSNSNGNWHNCSRHGRLQEWRHVLLRTKIQQQWLLVHCVLGIVILRHRKLHALWLAKKHALSEYKTYKACFTVFEVRSAEMFGKLYFECGQSTVICKEKGKENTELWNKASRTRLTTRDKCRKHLPSAAYAFCISLVSSNACCFCLPTLLNNITMNYI